MSILKYIKDKKFLIFFFILLMIFINAVIYLDTGISVDKNSLFYINFVSTVFFCIYLLLDYLFIKRYYSRIKFIIDNKPQDITNSLPRAITYEHIMNNELLKILNEDKEGKIEALREEIKQNQEFITTWVHEVKTPISVIRLTIENSLEKPIDKILPSIEEEVDKIEDKVYQALYFSRIDSFSKDYFINETDLNKAAREAVKRNAKAFINKKIRVEIEDKEAAVLTDKKWLGFIIDQILSNSLKYTPAEGMIKFSIYEDSKEKRLIIEDNGIGIKPEDIKRVFNKGFTGSTGRQHQNSTGMGLYLAKRLSRKLGHDITLESIYGEYTRVTIHFPKLTDYFNVTKM